MATGDLEVLVIAGANLKDVEAVGKQDPYVMLELAGQKFRTKTVTDGGKAPLFNERFRFVNITPNYATEIQVKVVDHNVVFSDKEIGSGRFALTQIYQAGMKEVMIPLSTTKGKSAGELQVLMTWKPYS